MADKIEIEKTTEYKNEKGNKVSVKSFITRNLNSKNFRRGVFLYTGLVFSTYFFKSYQSGKDALVKLGEEKSNVRWKTVKKAVNDDSLDNFFYSISLPFSVVSDIVPYVIFKLNDSGK